MIDRTNADYAAYIEPIRAELQGLIYGVAERAEQAGDAPLSGSRGATDDIADRTLMPPFTSPPALEGRHAGMLQLHAAEEHFLAMGRLYVMDEVVTFSDKVLLRAGIEACARSAWHLDPAIDHRARIARWLSERLYGYHYSRQFAEGRELVEVDAQREIMCKKASDAGFVVQRNKKNAWHIVSQPRPSATEVMGGLLDEPTGLSRMGLGRASQNYLSMFVHSSTMGLVTMMDRDQATRRGEFDVTVPLVSDSQSAAQLIGLAVSAYISAAGPALTYFGWMDSAWSRQLLNASRIVKRYFG